MATTKTLSIDEITMSAGQTGSEYCDLVYKVYYNTTYTDDDGWDDGGDGVVEASDSDGILEGSGFYLAKSSIDSTISANFIESIDITSDPLTIGIQTDDNTYSGNNNY